ncbi:hypothetical protein [Lactobacillus delbrueckii]|uniref:hypothetical protein n=2 Tax=Lactobacillus delbrueckii TaxID=1584 RepID=UPI001E302DA7|nr:hypothetical protein [Lactobacillus delbrueckii]MCD5602070.1 hypothetical protein [Lactobacillus delbrueckii subsp. lactis]
MSHKHDPNFNNKLNGKEKFGFRKLSIVLVAVALYTSFFVGSGQLVHAADDTATETVVQQANASDSSSADTNSSTTVEESTRKALAANLLQKLHLQRRLIVNLLQKERPLLLMSKSKPL